MRVARSCVAASALLALLAMAPGRAKAQNAAAFAPGVGTIPDGVSLSVTPAVSADRRYVRLSVQPYFSTIDGFQTLIFPAGAVGGAGGIGGGGGGGQGFRSVMGGPADFATWYPALGVPRGQDGVSAPAKPLRAATARPKKPYADPVIVPIKKKTEAGKAAGPRG
jgi:hypothetical protein